MSSSQNRAVSGLLTPMLRVPRHRKERRGLAVTVE